MDNKKFAAWDEAIRNQVAEEMSEIKDEPGYHGDMAKERYWELWQEKLNEEADESDCPDFDPSRPEHHF